MRPLKGSFTSMAALPCCPPPPFTYLGPSSQSSVSYVVVQSFNCVQHFATPWTTARQASLSFTISRSLLKFMSIESEMPFNHCILCRPLLSPSVFPIIKVFSNESALRIRWPKYWNFSVTLWTAAHQVLLSLTISQSLPQFMSMHQ